MNIIPLGDNCAISTILRDLNKRNKAYPFDWISSTGPDATFSSITKTIDLFIKLLKTGNPKNVTDDLLGGVVCDDHKDYNEIVFPHDNGTVEELYSKYFRRMTRLYEDVTAKNSNNMFILLTRYYLIPKEKLLELTDVLSELNINFKIILISGINHEYHTEIKNLESKYIPYNIEFDIKYCWLYDKKYFRPILKTYLEQRLSKLE
jgi:hypothetical protein